MLVGIESLIVFKRVLDITGCLQHFLVNLAGRVKDRITCVTSAGIPIKASRKSANIHGEFRRGLVG